MQNQDSDETVAALKNAEPVPHEIDEPHQQLLAFAKQLTVAPSETSDADIQRLRSAGWNDFQIAEAVYVISLFAMFNRIADAFGLIGEGFLSGDP